MEIKLSGATHTPITQCLCYALQINEISHIGKYHFTEHDIPWKDRYLKTNNI
jgi:hypothetical protein